MSSIQVPRELPYHASYSAASISGIVLDVQPAPRSKHQHTIGRKGPRGELVHHAVAAVGKLFCADAARVHARAADAHFATTAGDYAEHHFNVVVALWHLLPAFCARRCIADQKHAHLLAFALCDLAGQPQAVVAALRAVGRIVQDDSVGICVLPSPE